MMDRANGAGSGAASSRAERFEDEKRRIIDSCFSKKDTDGSRKSYQIALPWRGSVLGRERCELQSFQRQLT